MNSARLQLSRYSWYIGSNHTVPCWTFWIPPSRRRPTSEDSCLWYAACSPCLAVPLAWFAERWSCGFQYPVSWASHYGSISGIDRNHTDVAFMVSPAPSEVSTERWPRYCRFTNNGRGIFTEVQDRFPIQDQARLSHHGKRKNAFYGAFWRWHCKFWWFDQL